jgi:hypothetical protein
MPVLAIERIEGATMTDVKLIVSGSLEDDARAVLDAWHRTKHGAKVRERAIAFESWEALAGVIASTDAGTS